MDLEIEIETAVKILKRGGVVAFPTDTVYGLGAHFSINGAVERIFEIKGRQKNLPLPLLVAEMSQVYEVAREVPDIALLLARRFWPGGLTIVLHKSNIVSDLIAGGGDTVAVRMPAHPVPIALIKGVNAPVVGTSANLSGANSALSADEVQLQLGNKVDYIIRAGHLTGGVESTIIDVTGKRPKILRRGAVPEEEVLKICASL